MFEYLCICTVVFFVFLPVSKLSRPHSRSHFPRAPICIFASTLTLSYIYNTSPFLQQHNTKHSMYESTFAPHLHLQQHHNEYNQDPGMISANISYNIIAMLQFMKKKQLGTSLFHVLQHHNTSQALTSICSIFHPSYPRNPDLFLLLCLQSVSAFVSFIVFGSETWHSLLRSHLYLCIPCLSSQQELHR